MEEGPLPARSPLCRCGDGRAVSAELVIVLLAGIVQGIGRGVRAAVGGARGEGLDSRVRLLYKLNCLSCTWWSVSQRSTGALQLSWKCIGRVVSCCTAP